MTVMDKIKAFLKIDEATAPGHNLHVDALKGMLIIFVVFAHTIQLNHPLHDGSYLYLTFSSFAMPLFMLLSGYIISTQLRNTLWGYLKKYTLRLIVPFFVWAVVSYGVYYFYPDPHLPAYWFDVNLPVYLFNAAKLPGNGLWFLWVLFLNSILLFAVLKLVQVRDWARWENYFVIASILLSRAVNTDLFGLNEFKTYYIYYAVGFFACKYYDVLKAHRKIFYILGVIGFPLLLMGYQRNALPTFYPFLVQIFGDKGLARLIASIYKYFLAFTGMALLSFLLELLRRTRFYVFACWAGTLTLDIYVCHVYFIIGWGDALWQYLAVATFAFICSVLLTLLLLRRFKITRLLFLGQSR
jgi:fucose 4-O-acetylase-like acetyltransferase